MVLWLMSWINMRGESVPMPGKIALSSPGSALTAEERKQAEKLNWTDLIMSTTALDNIFKGMVGEKDLPEELLYTSKGILPLFIQPRLVQYQSRPNHIYKQEVIYFVEQIFPL